MLRVYSPRGSLAECSRSNFRRRIEIAAAANEKLRAPMGEMPGNGFEKVEEVEGRLRKKNKNSFVCIVSTSDCDVAASAFSALL